MPILFDACALLKRYYDERDGGKEFVDEVMGHPGRWGGLTASAIIIAEVVSGLSRKQKVPKAGLSLSAFHVLVREFHQDIQHLRLITADEGLASGAASLLAAHPHWKIRAGDAIHLATAVETQDSLDFGDVLILVTADRGLFDAAIEIGVAACNPAKQGTDHLAAIAGGRGTSTEFDNVV